MECVFLGLNLVRLWCILVCLLRVDLYITELGFCLPWEYINSNITWKSQASKEAITYSGYWDSTIHTSHRDFRINIEVRMATVYEHMESCSKITELYGNGVISVLL